MKLQKQCLGNPEQSVLVMQDMLIGHAFVSKWKVGASSTVTTGILI